MAKNKIDEIREEMRKLQTLCVQSRVPCVSLVQYRDEDGSISNMAMIVSPELVDFDLREKGSKYSDRRIYDISNIIQGDYRTVPILKDEEDEE